MGTVNRVELNKIDPKCWVCGCVVLPVEVRYSPLICDVCMPTYKEKEYVFVRATQEELDNIFSTNVGFTCR